MKLYDSNTGVEIGPATPEQIAASDASEAKGFLGAILIDAEGNVVTPGSWEAQQADVRNVFTY